LGVGIPEVVAFGFVTVLAVAAYVVLVDLHPRRNVAIFRGLSVFVVPIIFAVAGYLTPPDLVSTLVVAVPLSLVVAFILIPWILFRHS